jgi:hypothetical protein
MSLEAKIYALLSADAGVLALVSTRVYPVVAPQGTTLPYVVYQRISSGREYALDGYCGLENSRMQVDVYADTEKEAWAVADAVTTAMRGSTTFAVSGDDPKVLEEGGAFRVSNDFVISNSE